MEKNKLRRIIEQRFGKVIISNGTNGIEFITTCPVCGRQKLTINANTGIYKCWRGCTSGTLSKLLNIKITPSATPVPVIQETREVPSPGMIVPLDQLDNNNAAVAYLTARHYNIKELSEYYNMCYCKKGKLFARGTFNTTNTIIIPVTQNNEIIGWQSRLLYNPDSLTETEKGILGLKYDTEEKKYILPPKYLTSPGLRKGKMLYNIDNAKKSKTVVVTEGVFDAVSVGRCAVATFGKQVSDEQVSALKSYWDVIILLLDPDAKDEQNRLVARLGSSALVIPVTLHGYKDAGEAPREEIWKQIYEQSFQTLKLNNKQLFDNLTI